MQAADDRQGLLMSFLLVGEIVRSGGRGSAQRGGVGAGAGDGAGVGEALCTFMDVSIFACRFVATWNSQDFCSLDHHCRRRPILQVFIGPFLDDEQPQGMPSPLPIEFSVLFVTFVFFDP